MIVFTRISTSVLPILKKREKKVCVGGGRRHSIKSDVKIPENISNTLVTPWGRMSDPHPHKGTDRSKISIDKEDPQRGLKLGPQSKTKMTLLFSQGPFYCWLPACCCRQLASSTARGSRY